MPETRTMLVHILLMFILCCRASRSDEEEKTSDLCAKDKEVIFLLDSPKLIDKDQFQKELSFVRDMIDRFQESNNKTRIAVVIFSMGHEDDIKFDAYKTLEELKTKVAQIGSSESNDDIEDVSISTAISQATSLFTVGADSKKIIICVTNVVATEDDDFLKVEEDTAIKLKEKIIAIGVGGEKVRAGLKLIATEDSRDFIYSVDDFQDLSSVVDPLSYSMCLDAAICRGKPLEVVFLLHNSSSEGASNFKKVIDFTKHIVTSLDIGPNATQVAVVAYGSETAVKLFLNRSLTKHKVLEALQENQFESSEDPKTSLALTTVKDSVLDKEGEDEGENTTRAVIIVTSGPLNDLDDTKKAAQDLENEGVHIIVIGVGGANPEEVESIASMSASQSEPLHFEPDDYNGLSSIQDKVVDRLCRVSVNVPTKPEVINTIPVKYPTIPEGIGTDPMKMPTKPEAASTTPVSVSTTPEVLTTTTVNPTTESEVVTTTTENPTTESEVTETIPVNVPSELKDAVNPDCLGKSFEVVFVLYNSTKVGVANSRKMIDFTKHIVTALDIGPEATQVAAVTYGQDTAVQLPFNRSITKANVLKELQGIHFTSSGDPETNQALTTVKDTVFGKEGGDGGENTTRVVIVVTSGPLKDLDDTKKAAQNLKGGGVKIIAIGVGDVNPKQLGSIASMSAYISEPLHFESKDYNGLSSIQDKVVDRLCRERWAAKDLKKHQAKQSPSYTSLLQFAM